MPALLQAQAFGRFGYGAFDVPGFRVNAAGFKVAAGSADTFKFPRESRTWKPVVTTSIEQTVVLSEFKGSPSKVRACLTAPGFELFFPQGIELNLSGLTPPMLSFKEGGTIEGDAGIPTPALKWALVSFRDRQPPVLLCFLGEPHALRLQGKAGAWKLRTEGDFAGWVRIVAPTGIRSQATNTAAELGALMQSVAKEETIWTQPAPKLVSQTVDEDERGVGVTWTFDRPGALAPPAIGLAGVGGYRIPVVGKLRRIEAPTLEGPTDVLETETIGIRLSARRIPTGRALTKGPAPEAFGTASYLDVPGVSELALANCIASADDATRKLAEATFAEFLSSADAVPEPATNQNLLYRGDGKDLDLVGAHALLMQTTISARRAGSSENSLLTSLIWRRDWFSWSLWSANSESARRASALGAIAAAMAPEPERRLEGALLYAGIAAERGRRIWLQRQRLPLEESPAPKMAYPDLLNDLYAPADYRRAPGFGAALLSDLRVYGDVPAVVMPEGDDWSISIPVEVGKTVSLSLAAGYPLEFVLPEGWTAQSGFGFTFVRGKPQRAGIAKLILKLPSWAAKPIAVPSTPLFEER